MIMTLRSLDRVSFVFDFPYPLLRVSLPLKQDVQNGYYSVASFFLTEEIQIIYY